MNRLRESSQARKARQTLLAVICALMPLSAHADYASSCASCHAASATPEVNNLPNGSGLSGSIRAANNLAYLNTKITEGMGGSISSLSQAARQAIVTEIGNSSSVSAPVFTSASAPSGTVLSAYSHTFTASAAPVLVGNDGLAAPFTLASGSLPPGLSLNGATGALTGTPNTGGFYTGSVRANNLIGAGVTQSFNININKLSQTVTYGSPPSPTFVAGGTFSVNASASSGLPLTYAASGTCNVSNAAVNAITMTGAGNCSVSVSQAGNGIYGPTSANQAVTIAKGNQTINFGAQSPASRTWVPALSFALNPAATGAPLAASITYATNNAQICTIAGTTVSAGPLGGTCTVTATQNGDANYNSISAAQSIAINATAPGTPVINLAAPGSAQATIAFTPAASNGGSPITGYRAACNPGNVFVDGAGSPIVVTGLTNGVTYNCTVTASNAVGGTISSAVPVTPTDGAIAPGFTSPNNATFTVGSAGTLTVTATGVPAPALSLSGTLPSGVNFAPATGVLGGTPPLGTVGVYPLVLTANNAVPPNAVQVFTLTVAKASQTIAFPVIAAQVLNSARVPLSATSSAGLAVTYSSLTGSVCSVSGTTALKLAAGTCTVAANQAGNANYAAAVQVTQSFVVTAAGINTAQGANDWANGGGFLQFNACDTCHGATPSGRQLNAANAPGFIAYLYANNFAASHLNGLPVPPNTTQQAELASYIGTFVPPTNPVNRAILHNTSVGFTLPNITLNTGTLTSIQVVTAPVKGSVFMSGTTAIYTPFTGQSGPDAFTYRGIGPAGSTDTRTATVIIDAPPTPTISSATSASATVGTAFTFSVTASNVPTQFTATGLPPGLFINSVTGQIFGTPTTLGVYPVSLGAANAGGTGTATLNISVAGLPLSVIKAGTGAGTVTSNPAGISCGATCSAAFNLNVSVTLTAAPSPGSVLAGWSGAGCSGTGNCVVAMSAAQSVTATFSPVSAPGAPTNVNASGGIGQVTVSFTNPLNNGGAPIVSYAVTCNPGGVTVNPAVSPTVVTGLSNGTTYTCDVTASNGFFTGPPASASATPQPALALDYIASRKLHGAAGEFDMELFAGEPASGGRNVEPRNIGGGFNIVFRFNRPVTKDPGLVLQALDGNPLPGNASFVLAENEIIVTLTGIPNRSVYSVRLSDIDGQTGFGVDVNIAFLAGDVNGSHSVSASDISAVKANGTQPVKTSTFRFDVNADGVINGADVSAVKARAGLRLP